MNNHFSRIASLIVFAQVSVTAVKFKNEKSWGLLQFAVNEGKTDFIRILLEHG